MSVTSATPSPPRAAPPSRREWPVWTILQWYGVLTLILVILFNAPTARFDSPTLLAWTPDLWIIALATCMNLLLFGLLTGRWVARSLGVTSSVLVLALPPGSTFQGAFFTSVGEWLVLLGVVLIGVGELMRFTAPNPGEPQRL